MDIINSEFQKTINLKLENIKTLRQVNNSVKSPINSKEAQVLFENLNKIERYEQEIMEFEFLKDRILQLIGD